MSYASLLLKLGTIQRGTPQVSASGEVTKSYATVATGVSCDIQAVRGEYVRQPMGGEVEAVFDGFFLMGADIREDDHFIESSVTYRVAFVNVVHGHHKEAMLVRGIF
jgi:hypothetical protein